MMFCRPTKLSSLAVITIATALAGQAAAQSEANAITVYSGRSAALVAPIVKAFEQATGATVKVRYATDAALLAALQEEGARSPADLLWANTAGALVTAGERGLLRKLPADLLRKPAQFSPASGLWVPLSARFRVLAYNPARVTAAALPKSVLDLPKLTKYAGRIGWTPAYSSFQDFVTALRTVYGDARARQWLLDMKKLRPKAYGSNSSMLQDVAGAELDLALTNHYYVERLVAGAPEGEQEDESEEQGSEEETGVAGGARPNVRSHFFANGDVGNLELVTGAGVLRTSRRAANAERFLAYLLTPAAQAKVASTIREYPVLNGVTLPKGLIPSAEALARSPKIDLGRLKDLEGTLRMLRETGIL